MTIVFFYSSSSKDKSISQRSDWAKNVHFSGFIDLSSIKLKSKKSQIASADSSSSKNVKILFPISRSNFWHFASVSYVISRCREPGSVMITIVVRLAPGTGLQLFGGRNLGVT